MPPRHRRPQERGLLEDCRCANAGRYSAVRTESSTIRSTRTGVTLTETTHEPVAPVDRDIGECPVIHLDPSPPLDVGGYWRKADELREAAPAFFNVHGPGYWVFTRHEEVRDVYRNPDIFSSESITPWEPEPVYRFIPTQIDRPDHVWSTNITYVRLAQGFIYLVAIMDW